MSVPSKRCCIHAHSHAAPANIRTHTYTGGSRARAREDATLRCMRRCSRASAALVAAAWLCAAILRSRCRHAHYQNWSGRCEHRVFPRPHARTYARTHARMQHARMQLARTHNVLRVDSRQSGMHRRLKRDSSGAWFLDVCLCAAFVTSHGPIHPHRERSLRWTWPLPHRHRDWARPHIGTGTGLAPTSAPGTGTGLGCERRG